MDIRSVASAFVLAALTSSFVAVSAASAETRVAVSPAILDLSGPIGGAGSVKINVNNDGDRPLDLSATLVELETADGLSSATSWTDVTPADFTLEPGTSGEFQVALDIPDDIPPGGHYTAVSIDAVTPTEGSEQASGVAGRIIVPVLIAVTGDEDAPTAWGKPVFDRSALFLRTDGEYVARAEVSNAGGTHLALTGTATVEAIDEDGEREPVAAFEVPNGNVLPDQTRLFSGAGQIALVPDETYELDFELSEPAHGRVVDDDADVSSSAELVATPEIRLTDLTVCEASEGELEVSVSLVNEGSVGVIPGVSFWMETGEGEIATMSHPTSELMAWPAETTVADSRVLAPTVDGEYTLVAEITVSAEETLGTEATVRIGQDGAVPSCELAADSS